MKSKDLFDMAADIIRRRYACLDEASPEEGDAIWAAILLQAMGNYDTSVAWKMSAPGDDEEGE